MGIFSFLFGLKKSAFSVDKFRIKSIEELNSTEKELLRQEYQKFTDAFNKKVGKEYAEITQQVIKGNSICPKCNSENVNNRIKRTEGEIKGSSSGYGSSSIFGSSYSSSGYISGKIDTNPVNKCNDCKHEWKILKIYPPMISSLYDVYTKLSQCMDRIHSAYHEIKFDANDLSEKFSSLEEKKKDSISKLAESYSVKMIQELFSGYSIELMQYIIDTEEKKEIFKSWQIEDWEKSDKSLLVKVLNMKSLCQS
jgi:predicted Zn-ribbon and HTH transcriptional regulator